MKQVGFTANIKDTLSDADAKRTLSRVLVKFEPAWGIVTEWDGPLSRLGVYSMHRPGGGGSPLVVNTTRYKVGTTKTVHLAPGGKVGRLPGRKSYLGPSKATVYEMRTPTGRGVVVIGIHLVAEVQKGTGYRTDWVHAPRVRRHKHEREELNRLVRGYLNSGWLVFVAGDTNFAGMTVEGLHSCWEGQDHKGGTLGSRKVDIIYSNTKADDVETLNTLSDHDALAATYPN